MSVTNAVPAHGVFELECLRAYSEESVEDRQHDQREECGRDLFRFELSPPHRAYGGIFQGLSQHVGGFIDKGSEIPVSHIHANPHVPLAVFPVDRRAP